MWRESCGSARTTPRFDLNSGLFYHKLISLRLSGKHSHVLLGSDKHPLGRIAKMSSAVVSSELNKEQRALCRWQLSFKCTSIYHSTIICYFMAFRFFSAFSLPLRKDQFPLDEWFSIIKWIAECASNCVRISFINDESLLLLSAEEEREREVWLVRCGKAKKRETEREC